MHLGFGGVVLSLTEVEQPCNRENISAILFIFLILTIPSPFFFFFQARSVTNAASCFYKQCYNYMK
jgi:hypothetical protein